MKKIINLIKKIVLRQDYVSPFSLDLKGKKIVITGANKGIGKAIAEVLLAEGATVLLVSRSKINIKKEFKKYDLNSIYNFVADVSVEDNVLALVKDIKTIFGSIDVVVNNAGQNIDMELETTTSANFDDIINTNLKGTYLVCRSVLPILKKQKSGTIINIGSKISHNTNIKPNKVLYATSKYAIEGFSFALNKELKSFGVRVVCLMPGTVNTFLSKDLDNYMSVYDVATVVMMVIKLENIDFEGMVFKSVKQNI